MKQQVQLLDIPIPDTIDIERQVLADIVNYQDVMGEVLPIIHPTFFTSQERRGIWETMVRRFNNGEDFGLQSLWSLLPSFRDEVMPKIGEDGGRHTVRSHVAILRTGAARRRYYMAAVAHLQQAMSPEKSERDIIDSVGSFAAEVEGPAPIQPESTISQALDEVETEIASIEQAIAAGVRYRVATGFRSLDKFLYGGFRPGQLVVLAARPNVGKTSVMLNIAKNAARSGFPVYICTLEMNSKELGEKFIFSTGQVLPSEINGGRVDKSRLKAGRSDLDKLPIQINPFSRGLDEIVARITQAVKRGNCKVAMVDYIGLIADCSQLGGGVKLYQVIEKITKTLKALAQRLGITVIALSQLNRESVRQDRAPQLYDLRDSGALEQDADVVIMLQDIPETKQIVAWLRKSRNGPHKDDTGEDVGIALAPNATYSEFEDKGPYQVEQGEKLPPAPKGKLLGATYGTTHPTEQEQFPDEPDLPF